MKIFSTLSACVASAVMVGAMLISCNRDVLIEASGQKPQIILDSEYGVYEVKVGGELTISPEYKNLDGGNIIWDLEGEIVCRTQSWTAVWPEKGEFYVTITAENSRGSVSEDLRIDVLELTPPVISVNIPAQGYIVRPDEELIIAPTYKYDDLGDFEVRWFVDGEECGHEASFVFARSETGRYGVVVEASNADGKSSVEFYVEVSESGASKVSFPTASLGVQSTTRYTFAGRPVYLRPVVEDGSGQSFSWYVDGERVDCTADMYCFETAEAGEYEIKVVVDEKESATVTVVCVAGSEASMMRRPTAGSKSEFDKVFEWVPAPGQFINETSSIGGMTGLETDMESACAWAADRMARGYFVSLGSFGGYIIVGFDHSIAAGQDDYDFWVGGNAFVANNGGSNEPGVVWVMQDVNGNGLPDDEWYELRGSESEGGKVRKFYNVTYYRPSGPAMDVNWTASDGATGMVRYMGAFHPQDYYYPAWIGTPSYTLSGTLLPTHNSMDPQTGKWNNRPYGWGYADNVGSDNLPGAASAGEGQRNGFRISNAVFADGSPAGLLYVDFIKVQTGILAQSGVLGEVSTEVSGFADCGLE